ncbi:MAG: hypothetical protein AB7T49_19095 [Oligoflexales bacterium]
MKKIFLTVSLFGMASIAGCKSTDGSKTMNNTEAASEATIAAGPEVQFGKVPEGPGNYNGCNTYLFKTKFPGGTAEDLETFCRNKTRVVKDKIQGYQIKKSDGTSGPCEPVDNMDSYEACLTYATEEGKPVIPGDQEEVEAGAEVHFTRHYEGQPNGNPCAGYAFKTMFPGGTRADLKDYCRNGTQVSDPVNGYKVKKKDGTWSECKSIGEMDAYKACLSHATEK